MPPVTSRKIFIWSLPAFILFSFLWYKRKKSFLRSDPDGTASKPELVETITGETSSGLIAQEAVLVEDKAVETSSREESDEIITDISSSLSEIEASISVELICEVEKTSENLARPFIPDALDISHQIQTLPDFDSEETTLSSDLESPTSDNILAEELISYYIVPTESSKTQKVETQQVDQSWAEECETMMAHEVSSSEVESKLAALNMEVAVVHGVVAAVKEARDSANHSPAEVMLGSPSLSNYSDSQSEGSSDSGKGCSDVVTPPSRTPASGSSVSGDLALTSVYEFVLPQFLVGRLIGRHGAFVHQIKAKTHANILIKRHPDTNKVKICAIEGTVIDIESALEMIRQKFPLKRYPNVTLEQIQAATAGPLVSDNFQLHLVEGVNNDVILSSLVSPAHFFLQQPTHPTFPSLNRLNTCMNLCYNEPLAPALPTPIADSVICVAPVMGGWYRAQVLTSYPATDTSYVKFIDYGGYLSVENALLRQIRSDFISLPFQAAECYLANVKPVGGVWACEAMAVVEELTQGQVIQAQIHGYADDGVPVVYLFSIQGTQVLVVNRELVLRGYAEWDEPTGEVNAALEVQA